MIPTAITLEATVPSALWTAARAAAVLGVPPTTLAAWRPTGRVTGFAFVRVSRAVRYRPSDVEAFIEAGRQQPDQRVSALRARISEIPEQLAKPREFSADPVYDAAPLASMDEFAELIAARRDVVGESE